VPDGGVSRLSVGARVAFPEEPGGRGAAGQHGQVVRQARNALTLSAVGEPAMFALMFAESRAVTLVASAIALRA